MTTSSNDLTKAARANNGDEGSAEKRITNKELRSLFWRSFPLNIMWSFDRQMNVGFCYDMIPVIKRLYDKREDAAKKSAARSIERAVRGEKNI